MNLRGDARLSCFLERKRLTRHTVYVPILKARHFQSSCQHLPSRGGLAKGILFRNKVQHGNVMQHSIARATGKQDASRCRAKFPLLGARTVFFSFWIAAERRVVK
jgi:hypothetical protein